jgi:phage terminase small subunit
MKDLKHIKKFNETTENLNTSDVTLQEIMNDFYDEYESSYIDINTHGVIVKLIKELKDNGLLIGGDWDDTLSGEQ